MTLTNRNVIRIEVPFGTSFGTTMNEIRTWLDSNKIQPANCRSVQISTGTELEINFHNEDDASRFEQQFNR